MEDLGNKALQIFNAESGALLMEVNELRTENTKLRGERDKLRDFVDCVASPLEITADWHAGVVKAARALLSKLEGGG